MDEKTLQLLLERLAVLEKRVGATERYAIDPTDVSRPSIVGNMTKVYTSDIPLYTWVEGQALPVTLSVGRLYKVIDDTGPQFETPGDTGAITDDERAVGTCANTITVNSCQRDYKAYRVAVEACMEETDIDVPIIQGRDGIPEEAGIRTWGDYRDVLLGEQTRQAKEYLLAQGLGNVNQEPESLETLINQNTTPNIVDNVGVSAFEFALMALLAQIGLTTNANSYIRNDGDMVLVTHPLVELTMSRRASLPGLEDVYDFNVATGTVSFMGIPVIASRNIFIDTTTLLTSVFLLRRNHLGKVEYFDVDREIPINEEIDPDKCEYDCLRLTNYMTGITRGLAKMGRVINIKPMLVNTIVSGHVAQLNNPNAGTTLGGVI